MHGADYGHFRHELIEELKEISATYPEFFEDELHPEWAVSPLDTGERFGLRCVLTNDSAYSECHEVDRTEATITASELRAISESALARALLSDEVIMRSMIPSTSHLLMSTFCLSHSADCRWSAFTTLI